MGWIPLLPTLAHLDLVPSRHWGTEMIALLSQEAQETGQPYEGEGLVSLMTASQSKAHSRGTIKLIQKKEKKRWGGQVVTGFIPAGEGQSCKYMSHQGTLNSSELKGKVQGKRYERPGQTKVREQRGLDTAPQEEPTRSTWGPIFWFSGGGLRKARAQGTGGREAGLQSPGSW